LEVKNVIRQMSGNEVKALHYELLLKDILASAERLPPFPDVVWKVMALLRKTAPVQEIEHVIQYDPAITARVLMLSQSAFYGRKTRVSSLREAILVLGNQKLMQVVLTSCASRFFQKGANASESHERELWYHAVATAVTGETFARQIKHKKVLTIYTACLLHDIGKTVLSQYAKVYLHLRMDNSKLDGKELISAERRALGIDHQELGELIAQRWQFPKEVVEAIGHHHNPEDFSEDGDLATITYLSDKIVNDMDHEYAEVNPLEPAEDPVFVQWKIDREAIERLQNKIVDSMEGIQHFLNN
jgi:putative nucleotidyltransferase with HDIG domain